MIHAWEAVCWLALVIGLVSMWWAHRTIERATEMVREATASHREAALLLEAVLLAKGSEQGGEER